jgi:nucleoside-diphosphate-sugar epimerase
MNETQIKKIQEDCIRSIADYNVLLPLKDQKILVAGGTGFVGKWICEMICVLNEQHDFNVHLYILGRDKELFSNEVPHLLKKNFITLIEQEVRNLHELPLDVTYVIHAASSPDSRVHVSQPLRTLETIFRGTSLILDYCFRLTGLKKVVYLSSNKVYGKITGIEPICETMNGSLDPNKFPNIYAESKRVAESICATYRNQHRMPIVICRPFSIVGPYQHLDKPWAVNNFIRDAILGGPIKILGNGNVTRSYLYGSDAAYWILSAMVLGEVGEVYNIGSSEVVTLNELAVKVKSILSANLKINNKSSKNEYLDTVATIPDLKKIKTQLKVKENFSLDESLERTIIWNKVNFNS